MASKPTPKKGAAKKPVPAVKKKSPPAKPASKSKPAPARKAVKPAGKTVKAPSKPLTKPAAKAAPKPAPKPAAKMPAKAPAKPTPPPAARPAPVVKDILPVEVAETVAPAPSPKPAAKAPAAPQPTAALTVSIQSSQGTAANGNTHPANLLVIVTCAGAPVTELNKDHFTLMEHFEVPGQTAPFSNNVTSFRNAGTGAYLLQIKPITGAPWRTGHHLGQLLISDEDERQGQAAFKLIIR